MAPVRPKATETVQKHRSLLDKDFPHSGMINNCDNAIKIFEHRISKKTNGRWWEQVLHCWSWGSYQGRGEDKNDPGGNRLELETHMYKWLHRESYRYLYTHSLVRTHICPCSVS